MKPFDIHLFHSLGLPEACAYTEPYMADGAPLTETDYDFFIERWDELGDAQRLYAIEFGMAAQPDRFMPLVVDAMAHPEVAVVVAAMNQLNRCPRDLLERYSSRLRQIPVVSVSAFDPRYADSRHPMGTNERFVSEVIDRLQPTVEFKRSA